MNKEINLDAKVGDEITLRNGDHTLVVKIAEDGVVPDFLNATIAAIKSDAHLVSLAANSVYHREHNAEAYARATLAGIRDKIFASIVPAPETDATDADDKTQATAKRRAKN